MASSNDVTPKKFMDAWNALIPREQTAFREQDKYVRMARSGTVDMIMNEENKFTLQCNESKSPYTDQAPELANTVRPVKPDLKHQQIEAVLEMIGQIMASRVPRGLVLDQDNVSSSPFPSSVLPKTADVLGSGKSAGDVIVMTDKKKGTKLALKTILISQFNKNEIRLWIQLGDEGKAPKLYHFELRDNRIHFTMEVMSGCDLQKVIEKMWSFKDNELARNFSLCVLYDMLDIQRRMKNLEYSHGDIHAGNWRLEHSMALKIFDFGSVKSLMSQHGRNDFIKKDIVGIIRVFSALYSGYEFDDMFHAMKILSTQSLHELDEFMIHITDEHRKEMFEVIVMLFDTVRDKNDDNFGDTSEVSSHVSSLIKGDITEIKKRAAVIIFPERFQNQMECDGVDGSDSEMAVGDDFDPIWDDPGMPGFVAQVSDRALEELLC